MMTADRSTGSFGSGTTTMLGTRIHAQMGTRPDLSDLAGWCEAALEVVDWVVVASDDVMHGEATRRVAHLGPRVRVLLVSPWLAFTPALNAIVGEAKRVQADKLLLMSREVRAEQATIDSLKPWIGSNVLVVGARLSDDHGERMGPQTI